MWWDAAIFRMQSHRVTHKNLARFDKFVFAFENLDHQSIIENMLQKNVTRLERVDTSKNI
jgi:hypothetical protein